LKELLVLDLDGTITKSDSLVGFSFYMFKTKKEFRHLIIIPLLVLLKLKIIDNIKFKNLYAYTLLRNYNVEYINECAVDFTHSAVFQRILNNEIVDYILKQENAEKVLISANFSFLVECVAKLINVSYTLSVRSGIIDGKYTGEIEGLIPFGNDKVTAYCNFLGTRKYQKTIGIADDKSDLPLLSQLDEGYFVNFDRKTNRIVFTQIR